MKRILCYGDSNTWGFNPKDCSRYGEQTRWTRVLEKMLGKDYEIIEEGLRARTVNVDDYKDYRGNRNGALVFGQHVYTHDPLDYIVVMLGTNDMKAKFNVEPKDCAIAMKEKYIDCLKGLSTDLIKTPKIIIVAPGIIKEGFFDGFEGAEEKSKKFNEEYQKLALKNNCLFVSNEGLIAGEDGVHLTEESHSLIAKKIAKIIKNQ